MQARTVVGLHIDRLCGWVCAAMVDVLASGLESSISCRPRHACTLRFTAGADERRDQSRAPAGLQLDETARTVLDSLRDKAQSDFDQVLAIGLTVAPGAELDGLVDEAWLGSLVAEHTRLTVITGFSAMDRAAGGTGRHLSTIVDWIVARSHDSSRLVAHVDSATSLVYLPARAPLEKTLVLEAGPGALLIQQLVKACLSSSQADDSRGMLAVQGRQIKPLIRYWSEQKWRSLTDPGCIDAFVQASIQMAADRGWTVNDLLCTATHFVAASPADTIRAGLHNRILDQVALVGMGTRNGFLLHLLEEQFSAIGLQSILLDGIPGDIYEAIAAAMLASLTLDGVVCHIPGVTGAARSIPLGQFIPGARGSWQDCLSIMVANQAARDAA